MKSMCRSWRLSGGAWGIVFLLFCAVQGAPPENAGGTGGSPNDLKLKRSPARAPAAESVLTSEAADGDLLDNVDRQNRLVTGFLRTEVRNALKKARDLMGTDPQQAVETLTLLTDKIGRTAELNSDLRAQLVEQIEGTLQSARRQAQVQQERRLRSQQTAAEREARERLNRELTLQEDKVDQLMSRFNSLMDAERYRDAEVVATIADEMKPAVAGLRGAVLTARMDGYTADMNAVRDLRQKGFVDTSYQVELSHVPVSDEPPIIYPAPEVWQMLTERRQKYKAVDLTQHGPSEAKILGALDEKTELDFTDQALTDVIDYLKQRHDIEIQLDSRALSEAGLGSDSPITRSIKGITLRSALKLLLGELDLTYVIRNEVLLITTKTEAENMLSTRVYPVADLVIPIAPPRGGGMGGMGGGMGGMGGMSGMGMGGMGMGGMGMGMGMGGMGGGMGLGGGF